MSVRLNSSAWPNTMTSLLSRRQIVVVFCFFTTLLISPLALAQPSAGDDPQASSSIDQPLDQGRADAVADPVAIDPLSDDLLDNQVEDLKQAVLDLNRDLLILEEELLFPANTQITVFLSMDVGEFFELDSVKLMIDDDLVASELYTEHQIDALYRGGVQRLYIGNLRSGDHEITAFFTGIGPEGREYKRASTITLEKELEPKMLELKIVDSTKKLQPVFEIKEWQL